MLIRGKNEHYSYIHKSGLQLKDKNLKSQCIAEETVRKYKVTGNLWYEIKSQTKSKESNPNTGDIWNSKQACPEKNFFKAQSKGIVWNAVRKKIVIP